MKADTVFVLILSAKIPGSTCNKFFLLNTERLPELTQLEQGNFFSGIQNIFICLTAGRSVIVESSQPY